MDVHWQIYTKVIELSNKEKWSYLAKNFEFRCHLAIDHETRFDFHGRNWVLFDK